MSDEAKELALDVTVEVARSLHRVVRSVHDGHCPKCGYMDDAEQFRLGSAYQCPECGFRITDDEAAWAMAEFHPHLQKSVVLFERWRKQLRFGREILMTRPNPDETQQ